MNQEEILQKLAAGELSVDEANKLIEQHKNAQRKELYCKVSQRGGVSVYGLQRMPVTLYAGQWEKLLAFGDEISKFIKDNDSQLNRRDRQDSGS